MKKRLSLLMVLMMVVSLLPMSAFAAPTSIKVSDAVDVTNTEADKEVPASVGYEFKNVPGVTTQLATQNLRLELTEGAEFNGSIAVNFDGLPNYTATITPVSGTLAIFETNAPLTFGAVTNPLLTFNFDVDYSGANAGKEVKLVVTDNSPTGANSDRVGSRSHTLAVVKDGDTSDLAIKVTNAEKFISFDGGELSQFEISNIPTDSKTLVVEVDKDIRFANTTAVIGTGGLTKDLNSRGQATGWGTNRIEIDLSGETVGTKSSIIIIPEFSDLGRKASVGNVYATVESYTMNPITSSDRPAKNNRAIIGKIVDFDLTMEVVEKGKKEIPNVWGGEDATVKVTLKGPKGSINDRTIDFKVDGANVLYGSGTQAKTTPALGGATLTFDGERKSTTGSDYLLYKDAEFSLVPSSTANLDEKTEVSFEITIRTSGSKDGVATITAMQRGLEVTADLAKVTPKFTVETEVTPVKKGEAKNTATIVITEAKAGLLARNESLLLTFSTRRDYTQITSKSITVEATNGMTLDSSTNAIKWVEGNDGKSVGLEIPITRSSAGEPAVITISGLNVAVDGSATDDTVKIISKLAGTRNGVAKVAETDYIKVVKEYDLESILSVFTIGQTTYTVNGEEKTAASAPYIKEGRTMLPIRAVAESLGLTVQWNQATKTASFTDANKVAAVTIGASVIYVNGTPMPLTVPAELTNDTTFVELRSLATAFGVQIDWDAAAKVATVSK